MSNRTGIGNQTYYVDAVCDNCGYRGTITKPKGVPVIGKHQCLNCDCITMVAIWPALTNTYVAWSSRHV